jgi:chromosome partitioning protein
MITIAVVNAKGGVGKTTLASALAVRAASDKGSPRVGMVDLDPQKSLVEWWERRGGVGKADNPQIMAGVDSALDAVERAEQSGLYDVLFLDGPPAFLRTVKEMVEVADFALVPIKPSMIDLLSTGDTIRLALDAGVTFMAVLNDVGPREKIVDKARAFLASHDVPIAETVIVHRSSHITAWTLGKSAAEINAGRDTAAAEEIASLWAEVKAPATKAARARRAKRRASTDD